MKPTASVIIPVRNEAANLCACLEGVMKQACPFDFEVVVVDAGSEDPTPHVAEEFGAVLLRIPTEAFGHGRTRNLAARAAKGQFLVFLVADALPAAPSWLRSLLENFRDPSVGAVYGRHLPKPDASPLRRFALRWNYGDDRLVIRADGGGAINYRLAAFSNANSAIRRRCWETTPFPEDVVMAEDRALAKALLEGGWKVVYEPEACVFHSHNLTLAQAVRRYFDLGTAIRQTWGGTGRRGSRGMVGEGARYLKEEVLYLLRHRAVALVPYAVLYETAKFMAFSLGKRSPHLPRFLRERLSYYRGRSEYWRRRG